MHPICSLCCFLGQQAEKILGHLMSQQLLTCLKTRPCVYDGGAYRNDPLD